jgi:hypothetical protein
VEFINIDGNNDKVYVVYKLGNQLKTRKSTNAGQSWITDIANISIGNNACSNVDIIWGKFDNSLHVTWATKDNGDYDETYYRKLTDDAWSSTETVTNYSDEVGGFPTVSVSQDRVHFSYSNFNTVKAITRDKYVNSWQNPQTAFDGQSFRERVHAGSSKLFDFYYKLEGGMGNYYADLYVTERSLSGTTWPTGTFLHSHNAIDHIVSSTNTFDGTSHIVYDGSGIVIYRSYSGSYWNSEFTVGSGYFAPKISSASNDLFVVWNKDYSGNDYITYRQYDAIPLAPQGLAVGPYYEGGEVYARVTWQLNNEPDVFIKQSNAYQLQRRIKLLNNPWGPWTVVDSPGGSETEFIDYEVQGVGLAEAYVAEYRMRAIDYNNHYSAFSSTVSIDFQELGKISSGKFNIEYELCQNYPNPFNPSTTIDFSVRENSIVLLKVYDMLGTEVATLVNERKEPGNYSVEFNAANLPSGIYVYKLVAGNFVDAKKLILLK